MGILLNCNAILKAGVKIKRRGDRLTGFAKILLISLAACLVMSISPPLAVVSGLVWGVTLLLGIFWTGRRQLLIIFALNVLLLFGIAGDRVLFFLLIFGLPSLIMALQLGSQKGYYEVQARGMLSVLLLVSLFLGTAYFANQGKYISVTPQEIEAQVDANLEMLDNSGMLRFYEQQGMSLDQLKSQVTAVYIWFFRHLPAWYYIQAMLAVFVTLRLGAYYGRTRGLPIPPRKPFAEEIMPWTVAWVVIAGLILMLWGWEGANVWYYVGSNLVVTSVPVAIYFGTATMVYLWRRMSSRARRWWSAIIILNLLLFTLPTIFFLGLLGLFDSLLDYRGLEPKKEG
ncbi:MAG: DUF2232 domain-containing protein [Syntrophomonadaceae bacterium]